MTQKRLETKRRQLAQRLPKIPHVLRASLFKRFRRCGNPTCHCVRDEGHCSFYVGVSFPGGKTKQVCITEELVPVAQEWIDNYHSLWRTIEEVSAVNMELLRHRWVKGAGPE